MDNVDFMLLKELMANSRVTFRQLADKSGLSVSTVHKRVQVMIELGIIKQFFAYPAPKAIPQVWACVCGISEAPALKDVVERIGKSPFTFRVVLSSGNYLCVRAVLHDIADLNRYVSFVTREGELKNPVYGLCDQTHLPCTSDISLTGLDYRILASLQENCRKEIVDVADELGVVASTVRRHLEKMEKAGAVNCGIKYDLTPSGDIQAKLNIYLKNDVDRDEIVAKILDMYPMNVLSINTFSTVSNLLTVFIWTETMAGLKDIHDSIRAEVPCKKTVLTTPYDIFYFDTWLKASVSEKASSKLPARLQVKV
jgi:DNA-binding Lrp family transcriptional regulator